MDADNSTTYKHHFSLSSLSGTGGRPAGTRDTWRGVDFVDVTSTQSPSQVTWTDRRAGKGTLYDEPCHTLYRSGGAPVSPPGPPERPRHCDHRWGKKGPTYTYTPESQVVFGKEKLSDKYVQRGEKPIEGVPPAMYRPWTATSSSTYQDPMKIGAHWRESAKTMRSTTMRPPTATIPRHSLYKLGDPPFT
eukprot:jgi/Tetstr1/463819/TSEL_008633.t1